MTNSAAQLQKEKQKRGKNWGNPKEKERRL